MRIGMIPKLKVLELFAGTRSIGKAFEAAGHEVYSIDFDKSFENIDWNIDIGEITVADIISKFGIPDVIWASPDCSSYSIAAISHHRTQESDAHLEAKSEYGKKCDMVNQNVLKLIKELNPDFYFIENPRGGAAKDALDARIETGYRHILPVWRFTYETYGFLA